MKSKVDKLDIDKLVTITVDLSKLSEVVKYDFVKKNVHNANIKNINDKILDINNLATINTTVNAKINKVKGKIPNITKLTTTTRAKYSKIEQKHFFRNISKLFSIYTI